MSGAGRPLLAARTPSGDTSKDAAGGSASPGSNRPPGGSGRPKRTLIESACSACRRRKSRCDGLRPTCSRCQNLRTECQYEAEEGESRWSALRRRNQILEIERDQLRELVHFVQTRPEQEALEIFQRIRQAPYGEDLSMVLRQYKESAGIPLPPTQTLGPAALSLPAGGSGEQRLPPIQTILDPAAAGRGLTPVQLVHSQSLSSEDSRTSSNPDITSMPSQHRQMQILDTLEPSLRGDQGGGGTAQSHQPSHHRARRTPHMMSAPSLLSLSSEESTGSIGSIISNPPMDVQKPYFYGGGDAGGLPDGLGEESYDSHQHQHQQQHQ